MASNSDLEYKKWVGIKKQQEEVATENSETIVVNRIAERANSEGWKTDLKHEQPGEGGIDLRLKKSDDNRIIIIEAKGERVNLSQRDGRSRIIFALGQIILDMKDEEPDRVYRYCLAFPATPAFTKCEIPRKPRKQLGLNIFFVECSTGSLKVLLPDGKDAIDLSNFDELFHAD